MDERQQNTWNPDNDAANRFKGAMRWQLRAAFEMLRGSDRFCKAAEEQEMVVRSCDVRMKLLMECLKNLMVG
jgi:hypothetical protein